MLSDVALALAFALPPVAAAPRGVRVRPVECNVLPGERGANVWERAKIPELRRYCDLVASASAKLTPGSRMLTDVVRLVDEADALVPGRAAPPLLKGRALAELEQYAAALDAFRLAEARDARALDDPLALLAWARTLASTGDLGAARAAYRALLPRADMLPLADRGVAYLGAGVLAMTSGAPALGEAIAILREGRRDSQDLMRAASTFALALALDRSGAPGEALAVLAEGGVGDAKRVMGDARVLRALGGAGAEAGAAVALALDVAGDHAGSRQAWRTYLATGAAKGTWDAHARAHAGEGEPKPRPHP
jgi:tetratricopeptide (TPR) repeat protein